MKRFNPHVLIKLEDSYQSMNPKGELSDQNLQTKSYRLVD